MKNITKLNSFVLIFPVERANETASIGPVSVKSEESQRQSLHEFQKQTKQSPQEIMVQMEGEVKFVKIKWLL